VLASPEHRLKVSLRHPGLIPRVAIVDPELTHGLPASVTAHSGIDALVQLLEPWVSRRAQPMTDALCEAALRRIGGALRTVMTDPTPESRETMSWCSTMAGLALANAGLGVIHGFAAPLGGMLSVSHGALCAVMAAPGVAANLRALEARQPGSVALGRYAAAARWITGDPSATAHDLVEWLRQTVRMGHVPCMAEAGLAPDRLPEIVAAARRSSSMASNPIVLESEELAAALVEASNRDP
jgi:alcohol dehydrogenase class IV